MTRHIRWSIKYGETYEYLCTIHEEMLSSPNYTTPAAIAEKPQLGLLETFYLNEFYILSTERVNAMSEGSIPVTRIRRRAEQIEDDDIEMYEHIILRLDREYLNMRYEESERKNNAKKK